MLPAVRNTPLGLVTWKTITITIRPTNTGSTPLSPPRIRWSWARTYSPIVVATTSGGTKAAAAVGRAAQVGLIARLVEPLRSTVCLRRPDRDQPWPSPAPPLPSRGPDPVRPRPPVVMYSTTLCRSNSLAGACDHHPAQVQHGDAVGDGEHVVEIVRDQHHRQTAVPQSGDQIEDLGRLGHPQGGGRLVHDDQLRVPHDRLGDGHRLPLAARERANWLTDGAHGRDPQAGKRLGRRPLHVVLVQESVPGSLAPEEHVLDDVEVVRQSARSW